jgi:hypothetical protein
MPVHPEKTAAGAAVFFVLFSNELLLSGNFVLLQ